MKTIKIGNKDYVIGLDWETYTSMEEAKEVVQNNKEEGKASGIIPLKDKGIYLVYKGEKVKGKYYILATGFLHKASGAYYISLTEDTVWLFVKGMDGGILFDGEINKEEVQYKVVEFGMSGASKLSEEEIKSPVSYSFSGKSLNLEGNKKLYIAVGGGVFLLLLFFLLKPSEPPSPPKQAPSPVQAPVSPLPVQEMPEQAPVQQEFSVFSFNLHQCYEEYYKNLKEIECKHLEPVDEYMSCDELRKSKLPFQYGQVQEYDDSIVAYPFVLTGNFYYQELKELQRWTFAQEGFSFKISGEPKNLKVVWTGVVLCR